MRYLVVGLALLAWAAPAAAQEERVAKSKIVSAGLFKNGLAVIKRQIDLAGPGIYRLEDLPEPVHGTWWIESTAVVETTTKMREVEVPAGVDVQFQQDLAGKKVMVHFKGGKPEPVSGIVVKMPRPKPANPDSGPGVIPWGAFGPSPVAPEPANRFLILKTTRGRMFIDSAEIGILEAEGDDTVRKERKPVLLVKVDKANQNDKLYVTYLTHGLAWAPSYRVDISDPKTLNLELAAVIRNEVADLEATEVRLISGFPSVQFGHVRSPLSPRQTWETFFQQIAIHPNQGPPVVTQGIAAPMPQPPGFGLNLKATPMGEGVDLHFQAIGKRTLAKGEAMSLSIAKEKAPYDRVVEWLITENREARSHRGRKIPFPGPVDEEPDDEAWDALRFKNPFRFPMTTAPAMITANGAFNGQRLSYYVNAGEETTLRITKALNVRTRSNEQMVEDKKGGEREWVWVGGRRYQQTTVVGELNVANHRKEDATLIIRRRFSGNLLSADGQPRTVLLTEGAYSVNRYNEVVWGLSLRPGEERRLTYRCTVLVSPSAE